MLNIPELERRWIHYKIKSYIPHLSIVISLLVIFTIALFFYSYKKSTLQPQEEKKSRDIVVKQEKKEITKPLIKKSVVQTTTKVTPSSENPQKRENLEQKQLLTPSLTFMKRMQNSMQPYYKSEETPIVAPQQKKEKREENSIEKVTQTVVQPAPTTITIRRENTQNDIRDVMKRFKHNNNPALSLFIAKKSYELREYQQAYNYALITNRINSDIEASWIVFAKSLVKLGKKEQAIQTLKKYIQYSNSSDAKLLLDSIVSGKFR